MAAKPLPSQEVLRQLLDYDCQTGVFTWKVRGPEWFPNTAHLSTSVKRWNKKHAGRLALNNEHGNGYLSGTLLGGKRYAHRVAWKWMTGNDPEYVDHINGVRSDNSWENLRSVSKSANSRNSARPKTNTSGFIGVSFDGEAKKWVAYIGYAPRINLGRYRCLTAAAVARKCAEAQFGYHKNHGRSA